MVAGLILRMIVFLDMSFTKGGGVVISKRMETSGSLTQFRLDCGLQAGGEYDSVYSRQFYEAARVGDHLQFPLHGYTRLVRDNKIIRREFSEELIIPVVYSVIAILPSILFMPVERLRYHRLLYIFAGVIEVMVIGVTVYSLFAPC